jgi:hypothetical protein
MKTLKFWVFAVLALSMAVACSENNTLEQGIDNLEEQDVLKGQLSGGEPKERIGYVVGYETCGLSLDNRQAKGYIVISEDLKDTLAVYGLPEIFKFPAEAFPVTTAAHGIMNAAFPEKFRYAFKMRFTCTLSSEKEVIDLEMRESCIVLAMYPIRETYKVRTFVIVNSATKIEQSLPEPLPAISGTWEVTTLSRSGKLTAIGSPPENAAYSNILITISATQEQLVGEGHTFYNTIGFTFEIKEHQQIRFITYGGTRIAEDEWGRAFSDHIRDVVKFDLSNNELKLMDSQNTPLIIFYRK